MTDRSGPGDGRRDPADPGLRTLVDERPRLINLTYRLLGSLTEAEDVVQETYTRWYALPPGRRAAMESPGGWLTTVASRICLDLLGSARARRERYVGAWVPEPLPDRTEWMGGRWGGGTVTADPADQITLDESVDMAFLVVLDVMTPAERVAFILHDVFRYSFAEVAEILDRAPTACRQLASSARRRVRAVRADASPAAQRAEIVRAFKQAWEFKDIDALIGLLADDATATGDGGGLVPAAVHPVRGARDVARFFAERMAAAPGFTLHESTVNGQPGLVARFEGRPVSVLAFDIEGGRVRGVWAVLNPDKLRLWQTG
ncbi:RNA polymerase sigma factor SigJ [Actinacidiphila epipremni]|uniref:RNA polymerase sigma factor SigJ n=1 Tax=Actinacidiphila epipremni TaxID=2053013 RepID=A0ABX1A3M6_9ACTN|nr:RNA polymerase sigma factor SigJ [Actinacidiphila epipremni]NJP48376.1 RNA polymerase sigma factor SigJ [Actinacidiphila epipremni]